MAIPASYAETEPGARSPVKWSDTNDDDPGGLNYRYYQTGVIYYRSEISGRRIDDGTSNTYLVGEKWLPTDCYEGNSTGSGTPGFDWGENQSAYTGYEWDNERIAYNVPTAGRASYSIISDPEYYQPSQDRAGTLLERELKFGSAHAATFNMVFCDGSVHAISYDIDYRTHGFLANRLDGNSVTIP